MPPRRSGAYRYGLAVLSVTAALGVKLVLLYFDFPYPVSASFLAAIAVAFWFGGNGPGVLSVLLSVLAFGYFVVPYQVDHLVLLPDGSTKSVYLQSSFRTHLSYIIYFILVALLMGWFSSSRRRAELLLNQARNDLEVKVEERTADLSQANERLRNEIAERSQVEAALRRSEDYLAEAQRLSHTGSFGWNVSSGELVWSDETFRIFECDRTTIPTVELVLQRTHPEDAALVKNTIEQAAQHGKDIDLEHRLLMSNGSVKHVHVVGHALSDHSGTVEFAGAVMDVTEQHRSRAALEQALDEIQKSQTRLRLVIDTIPGLVWGGRSDGTFDYVNEPWLRYVGCSWEELSAQGGPASVVHPDDIEEGMAKWATALATGNHPDHEFRMRRADGQYRWFLSRALPLRDDQGNIVRWYGTATDIEDRKRAEEALRQTQADLAHVSRVTTMGELVASIAHEVNQPLGAIVTNGGACVRLLSRDPPDLDKSREIVRRMINDGNRASEVIKRIRELLHKASTEKAPLNINDTILEVIELIQSDIRRSKIELLTELEADMPAIVGDRIQLQQVILNLILNAKDAMGEAELHLRELLITSRQNEAGEVEVTVQDSGRGLDPKDAERIFDPFFTTKAEGMGLGLSISRRIIEDHGGRMWVTPHEPKGAVFQFTLRTDNQGDL